MILNEISLVIQNIIGFLKIISRMKDKTVSFSFFSFFFGNNLKILD
jgi:hypothetical protein